MFFWHVPAPNEALLISGSRRKGELTQFRIVTGHGFVVIPVKQKARASSPCHCTRRRSPRSA